MQRNSSHGTRVSGTSDVRMRILQNKLVAYVNGDENLHGGVEGDVWELTAGIEGTDLRNDIIPAGQSQFKQGSSPN